MSMADDRATWRPWIGSVWKKRDDDDLHRTRYRVIGHEGDEVVFQCIGDGMIFRREVDYWLEGMERI